MLIAQRYRVGASLGRGGMGEVYRGTDEVLGRAVAIKLLLPSGGDPMAGERFQREARAAAMLSDPHLVAVYDFGQYGDGFYLVMELVEGRTVAAELAERGPLTPERAVDIIEQSAAGLAAAHREDVVHRDIKPGNLLVATDGTVKVADFGIAHLPGAETTTLTATGQIIGSTHYLAPERARGEQAGKASDIYALGCVLYQLVTGHPPFTAEHPTAILYQHVDTAPIPPSRLRPELSGPFEDLLLRMLAKDPTDRPSADELAAGSLRSVPLAGDMFPAEVVRTIPVAAVNGDIPEDDANGLAAGAAVAADLERDTGDAGPSPVVKSRDPARRKYLLVAAIALVATAGSVVAGAMLNGDDRKPPTTVDIGPQPSPKPSTPTPTATRTATAPTQPGQASKANQTPAVRPSTSPAGPPSPRTSSPGTPTTRPSATTAPPSATARPTTSPSVSDTPSVAPHPPSAEPSDTPTPAPSATPAAATPTPATGLDAAR